MADNHNDTNERNRPMEAINDLLETLAESETDVIDGRVAPMEYTFNTLRALLLKEV